jgi:hypothetical protein
MPNTKSKIKLGNDVEIKSVDEIKSQGYKCPSIFPLEDQADADALYKTLKNSGYADMKLALSEDERGQWLCFHSDEFNRRDERIRESIRKENLKAQRKSKKK